MGLLNLPVELIEAIISYMIAVVGFSKANKLRLVNSSMPLSVYTHLVTKGRNVCQDCHPYRILAAKHSLSILPPSVSRKLKIRLHQYRAAEN